MSNFYHIVIYANEYVITYLLPTDLVIFDPSIIENRKQVCGNGILHT